MADPAEPREPHATEPGGASRSESVVVELRDMIMRGEFVAGFHLQEVPLAERMGVSRTPIREALNMLAKEGLLEPGPKRGYKIRTFTIGEIVEAYEVRATLEGMACRPPRPACRRTLPRSCRTASRSATISSAGACSPPPSTTPGSR